MTQEDTANRPAPRRRARRALGSTPLRLLRRVIEDNDYTAFTTVPTGTLNEEEQEIYTRVASHYAAHRRFPAEQTLQEWRVNLPEAPEPVAFYRDQLLHQHYVRTAADMMGQLQQAIQDDDGAAIASLLTTRRHELVSAGPSVVDLRSMVNTFRETMRPANSITGIIGTGIPGLDMEIGGIKAGEIGVIAARPGMGKTFLQLRGAMNHALNGIRVSLLSKEMSEEAVTHRIFAMYYNLDPRMGVQKHVSTSAYQEVMEMLEDDSPDALLDNLLIVPGASVRTTTDWQAVLEDQRPDIGMMDGTYFVRPASTQRMNDTRERLETLIRELREVAYNTRIANLLTWQQNRGKAVDTSGLYGTDALSQDAGLAVMVRRQRGAEGMRIAEVVKNRHGPEDIEVGLSYSFKPTNVGERMAIPTREGRDRTNRDDFIERTVSNGAGQQPTRRGRTQEVPE